MDDAPYTLKDYKTDWLRRAQASGQGCEGGGGGGKRGEGNGGGGSGARKRRAARCAVVGFVIIWLFLLADLVAAYVISQFYRNG